ncbi:MAG: MATE family efflux transporter, partial [Anaerovoracaceae bacterium]
MEEMTTKGNFAKYVSLSVMGMLGLSCYILADTFFVARGVGATGLTALNLAIPIYSFMNGVGLMIGMGGGTRFALTGNKGVFTQALYYGGLAAVFFLVLGIFGSKFLAVLLGGDGETLDYTVTYLRTILAFSPMFLLNNILLCFVRNDGNPKLSMTAMLVGSGANVVLDYIF